MDLVVVVEKIGFGYYCFYAAVAMAIMAVLEIIPGCG